MRVTCNSVLATLNAPKLVLWLFPLFVMINKCGLRGFEDLFATKRINWQESSIKDYL